MNTNLVHNIINIVMILVAGGTAVLFAMGCVSLPSGDLECTETMFISPGAATTVVAVLGGVKMPINVVRDGFAGLAKSSRRSSDGLALTLQDAARARRVRSAASREAGYREGGAR